MPACHTTLCHSSEGGLLWLVSTTTINFHRNGKHQKDVPQERDKKKKKASFHIHTHTHIIPPACTTHLHCPYYILPPTLPGFTHTVYTGHTVTSHLPHTTPHHALIPTLPAAPGPLQDHTGHRTTSCSGATGPPCAPHTFWFTTPTCLPYRFPGPTSYYHTVHSSTLQFYLQDFILTLPGYSPPTDVPHTRPLITLNLLLITCLPGPGLLPAGFHWTLQTPGASYLPVDGGFTRSGTRLQALPRLGLGPFPTTHRHTHPSHTDPTLGHRCPLHHTPTFVPPPTVLQDIATLQLHWTHLASPHLTRPSTLFPHHTHCTCPDTHGHTLDSLPHSSRTTHPTQPTTPRAIVFHWVLPHRHSASTLTPGYGGV